MSKTVKIVQQTIDEETGMSYHTTESVVVDDSFDLFESYYAYVLGEKKDANGNQIHQVMIGKNDVIRLVDVVNIKVIEEG